MPKLHPLPAAFALLLPVLANAPTALAQSGRTYTDADYTRAAHQLRTFTEPLVDHAVSSANWLDNRRFWYVDRAAGVSSIMLGSVDGAASQPAFSTAAVVASLHAAGLPVSDPAKVGFNDFQPTGNGEADITANGMRFHCTLAAPVACKPLPAPDPLAVASPDGKRAVFIRNWNLWLRDLATGAEKQLTTDGTQDYGYATDNSGWTHSDRAIALWSPDSQQVATFQQDQRRIGEMYTLTTNIGHPHLDAWKYPLAGDANVIAIERVVIDVNSAKTVRLQMPPDTHRSTLCDDVSCHGGWDDVQWAGDSRTLAFVSTSRDHKQENVRIADAATGRVRDIFEERAATFFESGYSDGSVNWRYLSKRGEILWWSQRSNWGNLYLYDASTGKLKHAVTSGEWNVDEVLHVDEATGDLLLTGVGRDVGADPYYRKLYAGNLDGRAVKLLSPEDADHHAAVPPDGSHLVDIFSTPQLPPTAVLRDRSGRALATVATADITRLKAAGWIAPQTIHVLCHDGKTQCWGLLFPPAGLDKTKKYPVIDYIYPGPFEGSVATRSFLASRGDSNALAQLGFAVVEIDGMGNPRRSKTFQDEYLRDIGLNAVPDQVSGLKDLAARTPWIDLQHAGIWGHSGGGNATAAAMLRFPGFFQVGISESGNHENRNYEDDWDEKYIGLLTTDASGHSNYDSQANAQYAKNLQGKLLLAHGMLDDNVPVSNTLLLVRALEEANKDFDLIIFPDAHHGYGNMSLYMMRRRWDYFVTNLMGATPPKGFRIPLPQ